MKSVPWSDNVVRPCEDVKAPRWNEEKAVAEFVAGIIEAVDHGMIEPWCLAVSSYHAAVGEGRWSGYLLNPMLYEQWAVKEAMRGNLKPLADLLRPTASGEVHPDTKNLKPATLTLVAEFLAGERNPRTGRLKGKPGRPKMSAVERRKAFPIHTANLEFPLIEAILEGWYPDQTRAAIHDRAMAIAAKRNGIENPETVKTHLDRPKSDRRRI